MDSTTATWLDDAGTKVAWAESIVGVLRERIPAPAGFYRSPLTAWVISGRSTIDINEDGVRLAATASPGVFIPRPAALLLVLPQTLFPLWNGVLIEDTFADCKDRDGGDGLTVEVFSVPSQIEIVWHEDSLTAITADGGRLTDEQVDLYARIFGAHSTYRFPTVHPFPRWRGYAASHEIVSGRYEDSDGSLFDGRAPAEALNAAQCAARFLKRFCANQIVEDWSTARLVDGAPAERQ